MSRQPIGLALLFVLTAGGLAAQTNRAVPDDLRRQAERRFEVLTVRDGLVLRPQSPGRVKTIEIRGGEIIVDGAPATGAELRDRLGADADVVIQLSYLDAAAQRSLFGAAAPAATAPVPTPPQPPALPTSPSLPEPPGSDREARRRSAERIRIGGSVRVDADEYIAGDVVAIGGSATVLGEVRGEVVSIGGTVELGPNARVHQNVTVIGGTLRRDPTARIDGETHEVGFGAIDLNGVRWSPPSLRRLWLGWTLGAAYALFATLIRIAVLCLLAALVVLIARDYVEIVSARAAAEPLKAGAIGFLAQVLFLPILVITIILLVVTIVGIPLLLLLPFALLGLGVVGLVGFTAVGYHLGRIVMERLGWGNHGPYWNTIAGVLLVVSPLVIARLIGLGGGILFPMTLGLGFIGVLIEYLAWTIGFGAVALVRFSKPAVSPTV